MHNSLTYVHCEIFQRHSRYKYVIYYSVHVLSQPRASIPISRTDLWIRRIYIYSICDWLPIRKADTIVVIRISITSEMWQSVWGPGSS